MKTAEVKNNKMIISEGIMYHQHSEKIIMSYCLAHCKNQYPIDLNIHRPKLSNFKVFDNTRLCPLLASDWLIYVFLYLLYCSVANRLKDTDKWV